MLVCGGGVAGIQASLDLSAAGFHVYLVEQSPAIGGAMTRLDKTFPTGDCATCIISPKLVECMRDLNVTVMTMADVIGLDGSPGDFTATVRLGEEALPSVRFSGISQAPRDLQVKPEQLLELAAGTAGQPLPLEFSKLGKGRLYYSATLRYALEASGVEARDEGIGLFTEILDMQGNPVEESLELGQIYRMRYVLYSSRDRDFLALRLPIPGGAEAIDGSLATSQVLPGQEQEEKYWMYAPVQRIYDNEVRFYYDSFYRGKREGSFLFRTTTPGTFSVPPATAQLMYEEEVFGRTGGRRLRILPR